MSKMYHTSKTGIKIISSNKTLKMKMAQADIWKTSTK